MTQLSRRNETVLILIKHPESFLELFLRISVLHLTCHQVKKLREINRPVPISIHLVDHILKLSFCRVLPKRSHHSSKFLGGDTTYTHTSLNTLNTN
ncbi:hypothetical protein HanIR_Chr03g0145481 [Helianthus annuus]|nr:hypothetical protein HanIR_Chr03g0145481 [Helianthus annuus]